jgi:molecular chaperone DnaK (HSP70)
MRSVFVLATAVALCTVAQAAMMGLDIGSDFIKIAAPKNNNIDIVLNEQSHRKTDNYIGFRGDERYFAADAKSLAPRFPDNMFTYMNQMVGVPFNDTARLRRFSDELQQKAALVEALKPTLDENETDSKSLGTVAFRTGANPLVNYTAETLQGMMFGFLRNLVKKDTGSRLRDATVTIPAAFSQRQRQALIDAGALAGVNVVGTVHVTTAIALHYGLKRNGFGNQTHRLMIVDVGAAHVDVGIYEFSPPATPAKGKRSKKAEALGFMETKAIVSDLSAGGRAMDSCLAQLIENRFVESTKLPRVLTADTLQKRKAVIALMRAGNKAKEVLSANKAANIVAEGMAPNKDFPTTITRQEFESECAPYFEKTLDIIKHAVAKSGLSMSEIDAVELAGGASRMPKLIDDLTALRGSPVDRTLNADEAAAIGAAFFGGVAAGRFRVPSFAVRESLFMAIPGVDTVAFAMSPKTDVEPLQFRTLFGASSRIGQLKSVTVNRTANFNITVAHNMSETNELVTDYVTKISGVDSGLRSVSYYSSKGELAELSTTLNHPNNSHSIRIEFRASESGLVVVESAELRINYVENVTRQNKVNMTDDELEVEINKTRTAVETRHAADEALRAAKKQSKDKNATGDSNATAETASNETVAEPEVNATAVEEAEAAAAKRLETKYAKALKTMKRHKFVPETSEEMKRSVQKLKTRNVYSFPSPLTRGDKKILRGILEEFDFADEQRRLLAKVRNDLEGYIVWVRGDGVLDNQTLKDGGRLTEEIAAEIEATLTNVSTWMDDEATDDTPREEYEAYLTKLKDAVKPVVSRRKAKKMSSDSEADTKKEANEEDAATSPDSEAPKEQAGDDEDAGEDTSANDSAKSSEGPEDAEDNEL